MKNQRIILLLLLAALILCACGNSMEEATTSATETTQVTTVETASETTQTSENPATEETVDYSAPDFTMYDADGNAFSLSDFEGRPTILNFWASWCGPCKSEMPDLEEAYKQYGQQINFVIVNLTDGTSETVESAYAYIESQGYTFPVYYDTDLAGAYSYGVNSIPLTFFIDANGDLVAYYSGAMSADILQQGINMICPAEE